MPAPYFFVPDITQSPITLDEDTSKHIISVLRMEKGEEILLTDGKGTKALCEIIDDNRKKTIAGVKSTQHEQPSQMNVTIAISLVKNASRFEWFLEKATEIGVRQIIPLICARTEKEKFRADRLQSIITSAMLQSQQCYMPSLSEPLAFEKALSAVNENKFIAHCLPEQKASVFTTQVQQEAIILIGPEGDFTTKEIESAIAAGFQPVTLGNTRLRTETAGIVAAVSLCNK